MENLRIMRDKWTALEHFRSSQIVNYSQPVAQSANHLYKYNQNETR